MTRLYLTEQGTRAVKRGGRLEVERNGVQILRVPLATVEDLVVVGKGIDVSTELLADLVERGLEPAFVTRAGGFRFKVTAGPRGGAAIRAAQYGFLMQPQGALRFAGAMVEQKLTAQCLHLDALPARDGLRSATERIHRIRRDLSRGRTLDQLRGFEGSSAALYWQALAGIVPASWGFPGRRHFPAPDPVNALLSFAYTLLLNELVTAIHLVGLDPALGALHAADASRPSLALDLEEPFRPLGVDAWVFDAVLTGEFNPMQFHRDGERVLLNPEGMRRFFTLYERQMGRVVRHPLGTGRITLRQALELHVRLVGHVFGGSRTQLEAVQWP